MRSESERRTGLVITILLRLSEAALVAVLQKQPQKQSQELRERTSEGSFLASFVHCTCYHPITVYNRGVNRRGEVEVK